MAVYYFLFMLAAFPAMLGYQAQRMRPSSAILFYWRFMALLLVVVIGFRYEVGGDWTTYIGYLYRVGHLSLFDGMQLADPGYILLNIISSNLGLGMTGVNTLCAMIFVVGLFRFLRTLPRPWLGLVCAIPYLVIVVGMGYTRQGVALSLVMMGMVAIQRSQYKKFVFWVILGAAFHKTAILLLPIALLFSTRSRIQKIGIVALSSVVGYELFLADHSDYLYDTYINNQSMSSEGALIRLMMNAIPAALFLFYSTRLNVPLKERKFWKYVSWLSLLMLSMLFFAGFSTALDRMALYLIPLQLWAFSHLPDAFRPSKNVVISLITLYYAFVLFVWLNFAIHAEHWIPYQIGIA